MVTALDVKDVYRRRDLVTYYSTTSELMPGERILLERLRADIAGKDVLDMGVGTGRTTPFLAALSRHYVAFDYSPEMVQRARSLHPGLEIVECDARDLSRFGRDRFDFLLFSFNGIDSVSNADRQTILAQVNAALRPGGAFMFSSHNLSSGRTRAFDLKNLRLTANPRRFAGACRYYLVGMLNHLRARRNEVRTLDYALLTDRAVHYRSVVYFVSKAFQVKQLEQAGFTSIEIFTENGAPTLVENDDRDRWLYYLARKAG
jgi:SAM-dependent methyltransferase